MNWINYANLSDWIAYSKLNVIENRKLNVKPLKCFSIDTFSENSCILYLCRYHHIYVHCALFNIAIWNYIIAKARIKVIWTNSLQQKNRFTVSTNCCILLNYSVSNIEFLFYLFILLLQMSHWKWILIPLLTILPFPPFELFRIEKCEIDDNNLW